VKVLAMLGSPRKGGNSDILLKNAIIGAESAGATVESIWLRGLKITPCIECGACSKTGHCVLKDDMTGIYAKIEEADRLIIASPVFFYNVSAFAKAAIDRFQPFWARKYVLKQKDESGKKRYGAFISAGATRGKRLFEGSVMTVKYCFSDSGFKYFGHALVGGIEHPADLEKHPEHLEAAQEMGRLLVSNPEDVYDYTPYPQQAQPVR